MDASRLKAFYFEKISFSVRPTVFDNYILCKMNSKNHSDVQNVGMKIYALNEILKTPSTYC